MNKIWYLYMVRCSSGALYTGITTNIENRVAMHNNRRGAKSVIALGLPVELVYHRKVGSYSEALREEIRFKAFSKKEKEAVVREYKATWDLVSSIGDSFDEPRVLKRKRRSISVR